MSQTLRKWTSYLSTKALAGEGLAAVLVRAVLGSSGLQIAGMGLGFLVGVQLARGLGAEGYGVYSFGMSLTAVLGIPTEFGLPQLMTREMAVASVQQAWGRMRGFLIFSSGLVALSSILIAVIGEIVLWSTDFAAEPEKRAVLRLGLLLIPVVAQMKLCGAAMQGLGKIVLGQFANLVLRPGLFALFLFVAFIGLHNARTASTAMALQALGAVLALAASLCFLAVAVPRHALLRSAPEYNAKAWLASAFPMALTEGLRALQSNMAVFLLGLLSTTAEVGLFRVADSTASMCGLPASMLNIVATSLIARLWADQDLPRLRRLVVVLAAGITGGVLAFGAPVLIGGKGLLEMVFGPQFGGSFPALAIGCLSNFVFALFGPCSVLLNMTGLEKRVVRGFAFSVAANVATALIFIPHFGSQGAALGNLVGVVVWSLLLWRDARRLRDIDTSLIAFFRSFRQ